VKARRGLSLVETIVSFLLLTLLLLGVLNLFPGALWANRRAELTLQAHNVADQVLEEARSQGFEQLQLGQRPVQTFQVNRTSYQAQLEVAAVAGKNPQFLRTLRVRVSWTVGGRQQELRREVWVSNVRS